MTLDYARSLTESRKKREPALERAVTLDASLADAHCVLGLIYKGAEETHAAAEAFQQATIADENYIEAYYELGDVLLVHLGDTEKQATQVLQESSSDGMPITHVYGHYWASPIFVIISPMLPFVNFNTHLNATQLR